MGPGRLMVSAFDLAGPAFAARPGGATLRRSVLNYMGSDRFAPAVAVSPAVLDRWIDARHTAPATTTVPQPSTDVVDPGQLGRRR